MNPVIRRPHMRKSRPDYQITLRVLREIRCRDRERDQGVGELLRHSTILSDAVDKGALKVIAGVQDIESGRFTITSHRAPVVHHPRPNHDRLCESAPLRLRARKLNETTTSTMMGT